MKTNYRKKPLTFVGFIMAAYDIWDGPLTGPYVEPVTPLPPAGNRIRTAWHEARFPVRITVKWRAAIAAQVPVGYEDETGFHYGVDPANGAG